MLLTCSDLAIGFKRDALARHLSFTLPRGDFLGLVGPNGAGKSTLVKTLTGELRPLAGTLTRARERLLCGYLSQSELAFEDFPATVREVIGSGNLNTLGRRWFYSRAQRRRAREITAMLGLDRLEPECYRTLSGGQRRAVLLARALCAAGDLLILDEPHGGLDTHACLRLNELISRVNRELKVTIIMITHEFDALRLCRHILHLNRAQKFFGSTADYLVSAQCRELWGHDGSA